jgi:hypothetical protein
LTYFKLRDPSIDRTGAAVRHSRAYIKKTETYGQMAISPYVIKSETGPDGVKAFLDDPKPLQPVPRAAAGQAEAFLD